MYQKIVVAFEGDGSSDAALRQGGELARLGGAELHLLAIVVTSGGLLLDPAIVPLELLETARGFLEEALMDCAREFGDQGVVVTTCIRDGEPSAEIMAYTKEIGAGLVVIGHSHKGLLSRWFEGSVGAHLLEDLPCSLLVAIGGAAPLPHDRG